MPDDSKKILVVDDESEVLDMITMRLESSGYQITTAQNGQEGLDKVKQECPNLIITDVLMPEMDGFTFYKELKKNKVTADIPVLVLTARGQMEDSFRVVGADDFIAKPFQSEDLLAKVQVLINRSPVVPESEKGIRVLVAGDDSATIENIVMQLKKGGCITDLVTTGPQVISKIVLFLPQILVMDVQMDDLPTEEIIKILRKMPQCEKIPIIVYSYYRVDELGSEDIRQKALSVGSSQDNCMEVGATEYIGRYNENTFMKDIEKYLKKLGASRE